MSDTPETDAAVVFADTSINRTEEVVVARFARKLERERDEARKALEIQEAVSSELTAQGNDACMERDDALEILTTYKIGERILNEQIAELRAQIPRWIPVGERPAPKDGTEIWAWREDAGAFQVRWIAPCDFLTENEQAELAKVILETDSIYYPDEPDWFCADFVHGFRLDGDFTHWQPMPKGPVE